MSITGENINRPNEADKTRRTIFIVAGAIALLLIGFLVFYLTRRSEPQPGAAVPEKKLELSEQDQKLNVGFRAGSPEFEKYREQITVTEPDAIYATNAVGTMEVTMATTLFNSTGRTITGLEMKGSIVDYQNNLIKELTTVVIPGGEIAELGNSKTVRVPIKIGGITRQEDKNNIDAGLAKIKMEITAIKFK
ncbi:MAG TPA: hypothetical protein VF791_16120 [Pyrinomonadaceae bacterium]